MSAKMHAPAKAAPTSSFTPAASGLLQRKCACGGNPGPTGECAACRRKRQLGGTLQTKLRVNQPGDKYEQEADRVADHVMRMPVPGLQHQLDQEEEEELLQTKPLVQWRVAGDGGGKEAPPIVHEVLRSPGQPLDPSIRNFIEPRFGQDFGRVRIHSGGEADRLNRALNARAFTTGQDIFFRRGEYNPQSSTCRKLLAHELTHVVQQGACQHLGSEAVAKTIQKAPGPAPCACKPEDFSPPPPYPPTTPTATVGNICTAKECAPVSLHPRGDDCLDKGDRVLVLNRYEAELADGKRDAWLSVKILEGTLKGKFKDDRVEIRERFLKDCAPPKENDNDDDNDDKDKDSGCSKAMCEAYKEFGAKAKTAGLTCGAEYYLDTAFPICTGENVPYFGFGPEECCVRNCLLRHEPCILHQERYCQAREPSGTRESAVCCAVRACMEVVNHFKCFDDCKASGLKIEMGRKFWSEVAKQTGCKNLPELRKILENLPACLAAGK